MIMLKGKVIQTGYYEHGELNGYGLCIDHSKSKIEIGFYDRGKKDGFFYEKSNHLESII